MTHPLDRPFWSALTTRQGYLAEGDARARRFPADIAAFAAAADPREDCTAALAALAPPGGTIALVEADPMPLPADLAIKTQATLGQMIAGPIDSPPCGFDVQPLGDADAPEMLALALRTKPGPFHARTHRLGRFIGVREDGRLIAMAGERLAVPGMREVSGVCTHPDHRGRGLAAALTRIVARRIQDEGDTPFLHVFADAAGPIRLYERLGFTMRRTLAYTVLRRG
jgi:ribosomal protein S18 acetylase RimI-like enzyme